MKYVSPINTETVIKLKQIENNPKLSIRIQNRAKAIRLSANGFTIKQLAEIFDTYRDTISAWIDHWEQLGFDALPDAPKSGRKPIINPSDHEIIVDFVKAEPRQLKLTLNKIEQHFHKKISIDTLKRILKKKNYLGDESENH